jgi:tetratricopeptide (TPR) repeat protein
VLNRTHGNTLALLLLGMGSLLHLGCDGVGRSNAHGLPPFDSAAYSEIEALDTEARTAATPLEALGAYRRMGDAADRYGYPWPAIAARLGMARVFFGQDQFDSAQVVLREAERRAEEVGHIYNWALAKEGLALVYQRRGVRDSALIAIDEAIRLAERRPDDPHTLQRLRERRRLLLQDGD